MTGYEPKPCEGNIELTRFLCKMITGRNKNHGDSGMHTCVRRKDFLNMVHSQLDFCYRPGV